MESWICPDCAARSASRGACPACGDGPCLELGHPETEAALRERDRVVVDRHLRRVTAIALVVGIAGGGAVGLAMPALLPIPFGGVVQALIVMVLGAAAVRAAMLSLWPPPRRFAFLDEGLSASVRGDATAMKLAEHKKVAFVLLGLSALGAVIAVVVYQQRQSAERAEAARRQAAGLAWANLWHCTLGGLVASDEVPARMRHIELGDPPEGWPEACSDHAAALFEQLDDRDFGVALKSELRERFGCDQGCTVDRPEAQFVALTAPLDMPTVAPTVSAPRLIDAPLLGKGAFASFGGGDARVIARDVAPDGRARLLLASRRSGHALCEVEPAKGAVRCDPLTVAVTESTLRLVAGGEEPVLLGKERADGPEASFAPDGRTISTYAGRRDGHAIARLENRIFEIARVRDGEPEAKKKLKLAEGAREPMLAAGHVVWIEDGDAPTLFARPLGGDDVVGERVEVGHLAQAGGLRQCSAGDLTALLVGSAPASGQSIAFHAGGAWHRPLEVPTAAPSPPVAKAPPRAASDRQADARPRAGVDREHEDARTAARQKALREVAEFGMIGMLGSGAGDATPSPWGRDDAPLGRRLFGVGSEGEGRRAPTPATLASPRPHLPRQSLTCSEGGATLTWREEAGERIHRVRCTPEGCQHQAATLALAPQSWWHATSLGDRTAIFWRDQKGVLRMRFAAIDDLAEAPDVLLMDSAEYGGPEAVDLEVFASDRGVVFWFRGLGFHALAVDAQGQHRAIGR